MQRISSARIKVAFWVAFLAVQMIWGAPSNSIDRVVAKFSTDSTWDGGLFVPIFMPPNTPSIEVAKQALKNDYPVTATNFTIVEVRQIGISRGEEPLPEEYAQLDPKMARDLKAFYARTNYTAVLFRAAAGERIVMVQFQPLEDPRDRPGFWWNRVYDPKRLLPQSETREYKQDRNIATSLLTETGLTYRVQSSTDLFNWAEITKLVSTSVSNQVIDFDATNYSSR